MWSLNESWNTWTDPHCQAFKSSPTISFENHECIDGASLLGYYFNHYNDSGMILHQ